MRISDWSSDVCSSDLRGVLDLLGLVEHDPPPTQRGEVVDVARDEGVRGEDHVVSGGALGEGRVVALRTAGAVAAHHEIGRASCGGRGCRNVEISEVDGHYKKNQQRATRRTAYK